MIKLNLLRIIQANDALRIQESNLNKRLFLKLFRLLMTLIVHTDENAQGMFGIVKKVKAPQAVPFKNYDHQIDLN